MKNTLIFVTGEDFTALKFVEIYTGKSHEWLTENMEEVMATMTEIDEEFGIEIKEMDISKEAFNALAEIWSDYDARKDSDCFFNEISE